MERTPLLARSWIWTPIVLVALAAGSYVIYRWLTPPVLPDGLLYGNGRIEGTEVTVSSEVTGRVVQSFLVEGGSVAAGDPLVRLEDTDLRVQLDRAQAELEAARREQERLELELGTAEHHVNIARTDYERYATLVGDGTAPVQRRDQAANTLAEAEGRVRTLGTGIVEAQARVTAMDQTLRLAQSQVDKTTISAPLAGTVLTKSIQVGELATPGRAIATIVDLESVELKIYIPEKDIGKIGLGDEARVRIDAFADIHFEARVSRVDQQAQFTPRDIHVPDERTRLVFGVTLALENPQGRLKPGMPADAWIRWEPAADWPSPLNVPR